MAEGTTNQLGEDKTKLQAVSDGSGGTENVNAEGELMTLSDLRTVLKTRRESQGLSQFDVAELVGVTQAFVAKVEGGSAEGVSYSKIQDMLGAINRGKPPDRQLKMRRRDEIKAALLSAELTLSDVARTLGVHHSTVSGVVAGRAASKRVEAYIHKRTGLRPYHGSRKGEEQ